MAGQELFVTSRETSCIRLTGVQTTLMIGAHPDDIEINAAGLTVTLRESGSDVRWLVCTDGSGGSWSTNINKNDLATRRKEEQFAAASLLGVTRVSFLDFQDGYLSFHQQQLLEALVDNIRDIRPRTVITHDPWKRYELHADHRVVGSMVAHAAIMASNGSFLPTKEPHFTNTIVFFNPEIPNMWLDIEELAGLKEQSILAHTSQFGNRSSFTKELRIKEQELAKPLQLRRVEAFHVLKNN